MEVNIPRGCYVSPNTNISRALLTHSYMSFMEYAEHVKAVTNNTTWADQVELSESQGPALSYTFPKIRNIESANQTNANKPISILYSMISDNTCAPQDVELQSNTVNICKPQGLEVSTIPYSVNQLVDPQLWNSNFCLISIFSMNEYIESNAKNIVCSLYQIVAFIRQIKLKYKIADNILQITEFDFATWNFILSIYKSE